MIQLFNLPHNYISWLKHDTIPLHVFVWLLVFGFFLEEPYFKALFGFDINTKKHGTKSWYNFSMKTHHHRYISQDN